MGQVPWTTPAGSYTVDVPDAAVAKIEAWLSQAKTAISNLEAADANWATLTANQKDAAVHTAVVVAARLVRLLLWQVD